MNAILELKSAFDEPIQSVRQALDTFDSDCPNEHYTKLVHNCTTELMGHPLVCYNGGGCLSKLRILRTGAVHYPVLQTLLRLTYTALSSHTCVKNIDKALCEGDFQTLMVITKISGYDTLLSNEVEKTYTQCTEAGNDVFLEPGIEERLLDKHAQIITEYEKEVDDYPNRICCIGECLYQKKSVTKVKLSDSLGDEVWPTLKEYLRDQNLANGQLYMCNYCKSKIKKKCHLVAFLMA